ncbi:unnamed protein product, partial [Didymodactylos carnosus]
NSNRFWCHLIRVRFGRKVLQRYTIDLFQQSNDDYELYRHIEQETDIRYEYEAIPKDFFRFKGWCLQLKMAVTEDRFRLQVRYSHKFNNEKLNPYRNSVLLSKLLFYYLYDVKRLMSIDGSKATHRIFSHVMPGKYTVVWRIQLDNPRAGLWHEQHVEFTSLPEYGELAVSSWTNKIIKSKWELNGTNWFHETMGTIIVYDISNVYVALTYYHSRPFGMRWDYVDLKITV